MRYEWSGGCVKLVCWLWRRYQTLYSDKASFAEMSPHTYALCCLSACCTVYPESSYFWMFYPFTNKTYVLQLNFSRCCSVFRMQLGSLVGFSESEYESRVTSKLNRSGIGVSMPRICHVEVSCEKLGENCKFVKVGSSGGRARDWEWHLLFLVKNHCIHPRSLA